MQPVVENRESEGLNARPIWFGPTDQPLFGWLHLPEEASAGVVLCRPIGLEALSAHRAYRYLAEQLGAKGLVTLQFDYTGTGDSAGDPADVINIGTWLADIGTAVELVRKTGVSRVGLIGLRLGATLAANAAANNNVETLVLWDPCENGRGFLREQSILADAAGITAGEDFAPEDGVAIPGLFLPKNLARAIRALSLNDAAGKLAPRLLLLTRPERRSDTDIRRRLSTQNIEYSDAIGQDQFIGVEPGAAVLPEQVIVDLVSWLTRALDGATAPTIDCVQAESSSTAIVARPVTGQKLIERTVRIGAENLFGIVTEIEDAKVSPMPAVLLLNAGRLPHSGPGRLWVEMARSWAAEGVRVLRFDLGGLGDSPTRQGHQPDVSYPAEAIEDVVDAARFIAPENPVDVVLVGLCSGGYHALEGSLLLKSRRVWLINPGFPLVPPELKERGVVDSRRQAVRPLSSLTRRLLSNIQVAHLSAAIAPDFAWWVLDKLRLYPSSARALESVAAKGTELLVVFSESEFSRFEKRSRWAVRRLEHSGQCHFTVIKSLDHSVFNLSGRSEVIKLFTAQVRERLVAEFRTPDVPDRTEASIRRLDSTEDRSID